MYWIILAACVSLIWTALWSCLLMAAGSDLRSLHTRLVKRTASNGGIMKTDGESPSDSRERPAQFGGRTLKPVAPTVVMIPLVLSAHRNLNRRGHRLGKWLAFHHAVY